MGKAKLSAVIHTKNSAATLERALRSVHFADEKVVVDMHSTDQTVAIARKFTKKIYQHQDLGYADPARNFGLSKTTGDWIVVLDDDEEISSSLRQSMTDAINAPAADVYLVPRQNLVFGQWIRKTGWWPDYQPRLFRRGHVSWQVGVHRQPDITGTTAHFPADEAHALRHVNYTDVTHFITKLNAYTSLHAAEQPKGISGGVFSTEKMLTVFANEFAKRALAQDGVEDGLHGTSLSLLQSLYETTAYLKEWQAADFPLSTAGNFGNSLREVTRIWQYWWADYQVRHTSGWRQLYWRWQRKRAS